MSRPTQKPLSRADELRSKRRPRQDHLQYSQDQLKRGATPGRAAVSHPVISRGTFPAGDVSQGRGMPNLRGVTNLRGSAAYHGATTVPVHQRAQSRVNRQFTIPLSTTGAELRLPVIPDLHLGWRLISAALVFCVAALLIALWNAPLFQLGQARLEGAKRLTAADINTVLKVDGLSVVQASPRQMERDLQAAFPDLASVHVSVGLPASLTVQVTERQPVIAWKVGDSVQWVDQNGMAFPVRGTVNGLVEVDAQAAPAASLPAPSTGDATVSAAGTTAQPKAPAPFIDPTLVKAILTLSPQVPQGTPILYSQEYGLGWNDPQGWQVYFGNSLDNMDEKLTMYKAIVADLNKQNIHPKIISVQFPRAPFYRLEQ